VEGTNGRVKRAIIKKKQRGKCLGTGWTRKDRNVDGKRKSAKAEVKYRWLGQEGSRRLGWGEKLNAGNPAAGKGKKKGFWHSKLCQQGLVLKPPEGQ